jgi:hypothetical protein
LTKYLISGDDDLLLRRDLLVVVVFFAVPESGRGGRAAGVEEGLQVGHLVLKKDKNTFDFQFVKSDIDN